MAPLGDASGCNDRTTRPMSPEIVHEICKEQNMYSQPHLNTRLYLNYKGFDNIAGLEDYIAVKTLHLGNNNISNINGLERMTELKCLFLEGNRLTTIQNLGANLQLRQLNLEGNAINSMPPMPPLMRLEQINLAHNCIDSLENLKELHSSPTLANVDVSYNNIEDVDGVIEFWSSLSVSLRLLRYHANPGVRHIENYRKRMINALPLLGYLDERPIFPVERKSCKAWAEGGKEAMQEVRREHAEERRRAVQVDPERKEILSRNRRLAIERIEREEREREEAAAKAGITSDAGPSASKGDLDVLSDYASKWRTKVDLYGAEGVREQVAKETTGAGAAGQTTNFSFEPTSRMRQNQVASIEKSSAQAVVDDSRDEASTWSRRDNGPSVGPASFITSGRQKADCDFENLQERQFAVLGGITDFDGPENKSAATGKSAPRSFDSKGSADPVMPLIWEQSNARSNEEEMRCLNQGLANLSAPTAPKGPSGDLMSMD